MGAGGAMSIVGAIASIVGDIKGAKEQSRVADIMRNLPGFQAVDPTKVQADTTAGNLADFSNASKLATATNSFNSDQLLAMMNKMIPGFSDLQAKRSQVASDRLSGKISPDVSNAIWSSSAAKALGLGIGGSGAGRNVTARDLGRTSLDLQDSGAKMTSDIIGSTPRPGLFDIGSQFLTPAQRVSYAFQNNENLYSSAMQQALGKTTGGADAYYAKAFVKYGNAMMGIGGSGGGGMGGMMGGGSGTTGGGGGVSMDQTTGMGMG